MYLGWFYNILWFVYDLNPQYLRPQAIFAQIEALSKKSLITILPIPSTTPEQGLNMNVKTFCWTYSCLVPFTSPQKNMTYIWYVALIISSSPSITGSKSRIWMEPGPANLKGKITFNHVVRDILVKFSIHAKIFVQLVQASLTGKCYKWKQQNDICQIFYTSSFSNYWNLPQKNM